MQTDVAEIFTIAARQAIPLVARRHQGLAFDYRGPRLVVDREVHDIRCCLHRLLCGMVDTLDASGIVMFTCEATLASSHAALSATVAGAGMVSRAEQVTSILRRLAMTEPPHASSSDGRRVATGICPTTHAQVSFSCLPNEGALFKANILLSSTDFLEGEESCSAAGARAWVIDANPVAGAALGRRLQRLGWAVTRFESCDDAIAAQRNGVAIASRPSLVVVSEEAARWPTVQRLRARLPPWTRLVLAVMAGSPSLRVTEPIEGFQVHVTPFSPEDLVGFTAGRSALAEEPSGHTGPVPLSWSDRPLVLIVDDNELNLMVGRGLVESSGYEVVTARDGAEAIEACRKTPPNAVLMDIDMPGMNGIDATRRLREMQLLGQIPPFSIVGATAGGGVIASADESLQAGMDGYLTKPLCVRLLQEELRRVAALR